MISLNSNCQRRVLVHSLRVGWKNMCELPCFFSRIISFRYIDTTVLLERSHISFVFVCCRRKPKKKRLTRSRLPPRVKKTRSKSQILLFAILSMPRGIEMTCQFSNLISPPAMALILVSRLRYCWRSCLASRLILTFAITTWRTAQTFTMNSQTLLFVVLAAN